MEKWWVDMEAWMEGLGTLVLDTVDVRISGFSFSPFLLSSSLSWLCFIFLLPSFRQTLSLSPYQDSCHGSQLITSNAEKRIPLGQIKSSRQKSVIVLLVWWDYLPIFQSVTWFRGCQSFHRPARFLIASEQEWNQLHGTVWHETEEYRIHKW